MNCLSISAFFTRCRRPLGSFLPHVNHHQPPPTPPTPTYIYTHITYTYTYTYIFNIVIITFFAFSDIFFLLIFSLYESAWATKIKVTTSFSLSLYKANSWMCINLFCFMLCCSISTTRHLLPGGATGRLHDGAAAGRLSNEGWAAGSSSGSGHHPV